jgi:hypothetical protein
MFRRALWLLPLSTACAVELLGPDECEIERFAPSDEHPSPADPEEVAAVVAEQRAHEVIWSSSASSPYHPEVHQRANQVSVTLTPVPGEPPLVATHGYRFSTEGPDAGRPTMVCDPGRFLELQYLVDLVTDDGLAATSVPAMVQADESGAIAVVTGTANGGERGEVTLSEEWLAESPLIDDPSNLDIRLNMYGPPSRPYFSMSADAESHAYRLWDGLVDD